MMSPVVAHPVELRRASLRQDALGRDREVGQPILSYRAGLIAASRSPQPSSGSAATRPAAEPQRASFRWGTGPIWVNTSGPYCGEQALATPTQIDATPSRRPRRASLRQFLHRRVLVGDVRPHPVEPRRASLRRGRRLHRLGNNRAHPVEPRRASLRLLRLHDR